MRAYLGIDAGTAYFKTALFLPSKKDISGFLSGYTDRYIDIPSGRLFFLDCERGLAEPLKTIEKRIGEVVGGLRSEGLEAVICSTGRLGKSLADRYGYIYENEFACITRAVSEIYSRARAVFEMGAETSRFIGLKRGKDGKISISEYGTNGECAAGTGSFIDQQALRMKVRVEEIGELVRHVGRAARIAGRCSVFAKSDMIHAQQKGATPPEILKGLMDAVARNFRSNVLKGATVDPVVLFLGGVAANAAVVDSLRDVMGLSDKDLVVPSNYRYYSASGVALLTFDRSEEAGLGRLSPEVSEEKGLLKGPAPYPVLIRDNVTFLRSEVALAEPESAGSQAYIGIDVGSVSTNFAVLGDRGNVLGEIYVRTDGRPVDVVMENLKKLGEMLDGRMKVCAVGTTGSGRELVGELVGADVIIDEISAHKTGASFVGESYFGEKVDTIFEIGGQDSKFISIRDDIVVDFAMNDACAAGTGSFLEEQAEKIGVNIKGEFADLAFSSSSPLRLGERCTVFMEQDVSGHMKRGAEKQDIVAGLAYAVVLNYLNRVVRGRPIGENIYFQGGTAYNDSVASAFSIILNKKIVVPPHNGVIGAIGAALVAREKHDVVAATSRFRGFELEGVDLARRDFVCRACSNECEVREITIEGEKTYWGDKCSERFRKPPKVKREPLISDLVSMKTGMLEDILEESGRGNGSYRAALPRSLYFFERFPFWAGLFEHLGVSLRATPPTSRSIAEKGCEVSVAEACFPLHASMGHVDHMLSEMEEVDFFFLPNVINSEPIKGSSDTYYCPWGQTFPFMVSSNPEFLRSIDSKVITPTVYFKDGEKLVVEDLYSAFRQFGWKRSTMRDAVRRGYEEAGKFNRRLIEEGKKAIDELERRRRPAVLLLGRPYNIYDREINLNIPAKIREHYGVDVIPYEFIPYLDEIDVTDINWNMFWALGTKLIKASRWAENRKNFSILYITNFKCGPDSFIRHYIEEASGRPYLTLQFDGHSNDAGYMTRIEAYLDSRGVMRWWNERAVESI